MIKKTILSITVIASLVLGIYYLVNRRNTQSEEVVAMQLSPKTDDQKTDDQKTDDQKTDDQKTDDQTTDTVK
jgi:hypothetical protein